MKMTPPTTEEVARRAYEIWQTEGSPTGRDADHWFEAERQLSVSTAARNRPSDSNGRDNGNSQGGGSAADPRPAELTSGHDHGRVLTPDELTAKATQQKIEARDPHLSREKGHPAAAPQSGKPLWDKPHSR